MWHTLANGIVVGLQWSEAWKGLACLVWPFECWPQNKRPSKLTRTQPIQSLKKSCPVILGVRKQMFAVDNHWDLELFVYSTIAAMSGYSQVSQKDPRVRSRCLCKLSGLSSNSTAPPRSEDFLPLPFFPPFSLSPHSNSRPTTSYYSLLY